MNKAGAIGELAEVPFLGEAALQEALAELRNPYAGSPANGAAAGHAQPQTEPPSKTVSQVLGEIAWLMAQSPRHKTIALDDLDGW